MKLKDLFTFWKSNKSNPKIETQSFKDQIQNSVVTLDQLFERGRLGHSNPINQPMKTSWLVYKCCQILADRIPKVPVKFINKKTQDQIDPDTNEAARFIMEPGDSTFFEFMSRSIMFYALYGESFMIWNDSVGTELGIGRVPAGLIVVDPTAMTEDLDPYFNLKGWMYAGSYKNDKVSMYLPKDNVIQVKNANPYNMWRGLRAIDAIANELGVDVKSAQEMVRFYDNFAIPGTILTAPVDSPITPEDMEMYVKKWNSRHAGIDKKFKTAGLTGGIQAQVLGLPADKQQLIEIKEFVRDVVLAVFGVPKSYAGFSEGINRATADAQERNFWQGGASILMRYQQTLNRKVINRIDPSIELVFDYDSIDALKKDINESAEAAQKLMMMGWSANDLNEKFNWDLPEYDGITDKHYQSFNMVEIGELPIWMQQEEGDKPAPKKPDQKADKPAGGGRVSKKSPSPTKVTKRNAISKYFFNQRVGLLKMLSRIDKYDETTIPRLMSDLNSFFKKEDEKLESKELIFILGINDSIRKRIKIVLMDGLSSKEAVDTVIEKIKMIYNYTTTRSKILAEMDEE